MSEPINHPAADDRTSQTRGRAASWSDDAAVWREGWEAGRRAAAALIRCGCDNREAVLSVPPNSAERWRLCGEANCVALDEYAILAMEPTP